MSKISVSPRQPQSFIKPPFAAVERKVRIDKKRQRKNLDKNIETKKNLEISGFHLALLGFTAPNMLIFSEARNKQTRKLAICW